MQLWDIAGQERFGNMTRVYYKEAAAAFIVFDVTRESTFTTVANWKADIDAKVTKAPDNTPIPVVLIANKCDSETWSKSYCVTSEQLDAYSKEHGFVGWRPTSAKVGRGIDEAVQLLLEHALKDINTQHSDADVVPLGAPPQKKSGCCG
eukprot:TRINITY_DN1000_c0_g2_i1.p1 TRINITY_DN1000_c0_g2~~TRINITY_DN1000_c0_g2_i1.p1  ORF type:complete len:149 (+),score=32.71 TRINITY_DN1000_c0_g2_i1:85-531(+)